MVTLDDFFTYMAQRDDAPDETERAYWRGYIQALADEFDVDLVEVASGYQRVQAWAAESIDAVAADARARLAAQQP